MRGVKRTKKDGLQSQVEQRYKLRKNELYEIGLLKEKETKVQTELIKKS